MHQLLSFLLNAKDTAIATWDNATGIQRITIAVLAVIVSIVLLRVVLALMFSVFGVIAAVTIGAYFGYRYYVNR